MKVLFLIICLVGLSFSIYPPEPIQPALHVGISTLSTVFSYYVLKTVFDEKGNRKYIVLVSSMTGLTAGLVKEFHDAQKNKEFNYKDLLLDSAGVWLGVGFILIMEF